MAQVEKKEELTLSINTTNNINSDKLSKLRILVTGGAGFIGSHIVEDLLKSGVKEVRILDNLITGKQENIQELLDKYKNLTFIKNDIRNYKICLKVTKDIDVVCHQAAVPSVPRSIKDPLDTHDNNVTGFLNLLNSCKENHVKRFVYASSSSVYGDDQTLPKVEEKVGNQLSPYALSKYIDEQYARLYTSLYEMECIGLRYFNVFGPKQDPFSEYSAVIPKFIMSDTSYGQKAKIYGDGSYSRDFTYVDNVVSANILAMTTNNKESFGKAINISCGSKISIKELYQKICQVKKIKPDAIYEDNRKGDIPHSCGDITLAKKLLNYTPIISFEEGLKTTVEYLTKKKY